MTNKEAEEVLKELYEVRPEKLNDKAKRLFEAIMTIADRKDEAEADLYEANNRISDLLDLDTQKDKLIDLMANSLKFVSINDNNKYIHFNDTESIKKYFEERCK